MPYHFDTTEAVNDALRRVAAEELSVAIELLAVPLDLTHATDKQHLNEANDAGVARRREPDSEEHDRRIHRARKSLKKLRGLLHLGRKAMDPQDWKQESLCFRDAARLLSEVRATAAALESFEALIGSATVELPETVVSTARRQLLSSYSQHITSSSEPAAEASRALNAASLRVQDWTLNGNGWRSLAPGLRGTYSAGRRGYREARKLQTGEALHDWRKSVKYLWYAVRLLEPAWPRVLKALASELDELAETLGAEHDLADVIRLLQSGDGELATQILQLAEQRRSELRAQAFRLGRRLYGERPSCFTSRIGVCVKAWWRESRVPEVSPPIATASTQVDCQDDSTT